ncbi:DUF2530 domain-containing protein [Salinibacterium sp. SYSU T00001]|uniref:DUF2530 domain-containing protein n=1 Tax=Homoserinimonas sedimenticola TaxID=2986805 RepID=UPI0022359D9B|nr:DUF2530 domain-containing protein [Salinibacterium sedimenticola]MCW4386160.1 DUF2530 domain-containing protein [Salinibacterium sedimenticola]
MRLWLKESERRPDPEPVDTDDRKPMIVGLLAWLVALGAVLVAKPLFGTEIPTMWLWSCIAGIVLGSLGLAYTQRRHGR